MRKGAQSVCCIGQRAEGAGSPEPGPSAPSPKRPKFPSSESLCRDCVKACEYYFNK
jgi:hypothetical protein